MGGRASVLGVLGAVRHQHQRVCVCRRYFTSSATEVEHNPTSIVIGDNFGADTFDFGTADNQYMLLFQGANIDVVTDAGSAEPVYLEFWALCGTNINEFVFADRNRIVGFVDPSSVVDSIDTSTNTADPKTEDIRLTNACWNTKVLCNGSQDCCPGVAAA